MFTKMHKTPTHKKVHIDFDFASEMWMKNKKRFGQSYVYVCGHITKRGGYCQKKIKIPNTKCHQHK